MSDPTERDDQERAEALDDDALGLGVDEQAEPDYPPERLQGADQYGVTAAEERVDEPLEERIRREIPDEVLVELEGEQLEGALIDAGVLDEGGPGEEFEGEEFEGGEVGRIYEPGTESGQDVEGTSVAEAFPADDLSAEEAAMHRAEDPPMGSEGGGYVEP